ncbi:nucleotidyltransferase domain-containing protein [bacterium]|nr:nucleotidyltransferase domain-containing protein [bacterium]
MKDKIKTLLQQTEKDNGIKILFAIENGSRSWGMASKDSDFDVRFVFFREIKYYLSLSKKEEVLNSSFDKNLNPCPVQGALVDICGFDIFKYLKLLLSSNPTTIEWLNSPIVYYGDNNLSLRGYMKENFNQERLFRHYFSLFKNNYREFIQLGKAITYKKYLYSMRGLLNAKYVYEFNKIPPLDLRQTVEEVKNLIPKKVYEKIEEVIKIKSLGLERDTILRIEEFDEFFNSELQKEYQNFNPKKPDVKVLNEFLEKIFI